MQELLNNAPQSSSNNPPPFFFGFPKSSAKRPPPPLSLIRSDIKPVVFASSNCFLAFSSAARFSSSIRLRSASSAARFSASAFFRASSSARLLFSSSIRARSAASLSASKRCCSSLDTPPGPRVPTPGGFAIEPRPLARPPPPSSANLCIVLCKLSWLLATADIFSPRPSKRPHTFTNNCSCRFELSTNNLNCNPASFAGGATGWSGARYSENGSSESMDVATGVLIQIC
mmetsp:Transcript_57910/g.90083  ORF Transcript_57910/g.90083 Transcript_57910/m.90083 type:complete len:230 (-) Transcript_57910:3-692(-)